MLLWMMVLAVLPVVICMAVFNLVVRDHLAQQYAQQGEAVAQVIAPSLSGRISAGWTAKDSELIDNLTRHLPLAFVCVTDPEGKLIHAGVLKNGAWDAYQQTQQTALIRGHLDVVRSRDTDLDQGLIVRTAGIWNPPHARRRADQTEETPALEGVVVLGLDIEGVAGTITMFQSAQLTAVGLVCLACIPVVPWLLRRWTGPLNELLRATKRLAEGKPPEPVLLRTNDELGYLAAAFNDMAGKMLAARHALVDVNTSLEQTIRQRTHQLQEVVKELDTMASTDPLTQVANRRAFVEALQDHFGISVRSDTELSCLMVDLDGFKPINDTLGHKTGDDLLLMTARVLSEHARPSDIVARLGGDEFALLMPRTDKAAGEELAGCILDAFKLEATGLLPDDLPMMALTMSMGLACRKLHEVASGEELIHKADKALYAAKGQGKACLRVYEPDASAESHTSTLAHIASRTPSS